MLPSIVGAPQLQAMQDLAKTVPPGAFAEIGVLNGGSAYRLYEVALMQGRELHLFDTFCGTPFFAEGLDHHKIDAEFAVPDAPKHIAKLMPMAKLHIGTYPETHPKDLRDVAFVHCDCDQYESYCAVIRHMWPLVVPGGMMLFDDYPYLEGAKVAVAEHFDIKTLRKCHQRYYVVKEPS